MSELKSKTFTIIGREEDLDTIQQLLLHIEYFGKIGSSNNLLVRTDGDGSGRIHIKDEDGLFMSDYIKLKCDAPNKQEHTDAGIAETYDIG